MFCRPCFNRIWGLKYIPRLFSEYMLTFRAKEPMKKYVQQTKFVILYLYSSKTQLYNGQIPLSNCPNSEHFHKGILVYNIYMFSFTSLTQSSQ